MGTQARRFDVTAPDLRVPMLVLGFTVLVCIGALAMTWNALQGAARIWLVLVALLAPVAIIVSIFRRRVELNDGALHIVAGLNSTRVALSDLLPAQARIVALDERPEDRVGIKTFGTAMPGYHAGHFRQIGGSKVFALVTDKRRVLVLPERSGRLLMLSLSQPQALLDAITPR